MAQALIVKNPEAIEIPAVLPSHERLEYISYTLPKGVQSVTKTLSDYQHLRLTIYPQDGSTWTTPNGLVGIISNYYTYSWNPSYWAMATSKGLNSGSYPIMRIRDSNNTLSLAFQTGEMQFTTTISGGNTSDLTFWFIAIFSC